MSSDDRKQPPQPPENALVKTSTKVTIDIGEFMPRIIELANAECRSPEQQVRFMFKRLLDSWDSRGQNHASFSDLFTSYAKPRRSFSVDIVGGESSFGYG